MSRRTKKPGTMPSITIHGIHFTITEDKSKPNKTTVFGNAVMQAKIYRDGRMIRDLHLKFAVVSCWRFPDKNWMVKAHLGYNHKNHDQWRFMEALKELGEVQIGSRETNFTGNANCSLMADGNVIRYGKASGSGDMRLRSEELGRYNLYESKAHAFHGIIRAMRIQKTIGGYSRINFGMIPNEVLESIGFRELPDIMRRGVPMWYGNPDGISEAGDVGGYYQQQEQAERNRLSFLEMIKEVTETKLISQA